MDLSVPLSASRVYTLEPEEPLEPGDISNAVELSFDGGAGWLIGLRHSIKLNDGDTPEEIEGPLSKVAIIIYIGDEPYTEHSRGGADFVVLSDFHGAWQERHLLCRRMTAGDSLLVTWKHKGDTATILPSMTLSYVREGDIEGADLSRILDVMGLPWAASEE